MRVLLSLRPNTDVSGATNKLESADQTYFTAPVMLRNRSSFECFVERRQPDSKSRALLMQMGTVDRQWNDPVSISILRWEEGGLGRLNLRSYLMNL